MKKLLWGVGMLTPGDYGEMGRGAFMMEKVVWSRQHEQIDR